MAVGGEVGSLHGRVAPFWIKENLRNPISLVGTEVTIPPLFIFQKQTFITGIARNERVSVMARVNLNRTEQHGEWHFMKYRHIAGEIRSAYILAAKNK